MRTPKVAEYVTIDEIKIDVAITRDIVDCTDNQIVIDNIMALCRSLEVNVLAEGVENKVSLDYFQNKHCQLVQGFFFAKPMPFSEYQIWLKNHLDDSEGHGSEA